MIIFSLDKTYIDIGRLFSDFSKVCDFQSKMYLTNN